MAVHIGADFKFYLDSSVVAYCENFSKQNDKGKVEITSRSSIGQWREYQTTGVKGGTLSLSGVIARPGTEPSGEKNFDDVINDWYSSNTDVSCKITPVDVSGYQEEFNATIDSMSQEYGGLEDKVTYSMELTINGAVTRTLV